MSGEGISPDAGGEVTGAFSSPDLATPAPDAPHRNPEPGTVIHPNGLEVHLVGADANARARDEADRRVDSEVAEKGLLTRIWKGNLAKDYYSMKYEREERAKIEAAGTPFLNEEEATKTIERFASEAESMVDTEAGESKVELSELPGGNELKDQFKALIREVAEKDMSRPAFEQEKTRLINEVASKNPELAKAGLQYADNIEKIAEQVEARVEAGEVLDNLLAETKIYLDRARAGVRTEAQYGAIDRVFEKIRSHGLSAVANEGVLATAISVGYTAARWSGRRAVAVVGKMAIPGISSGILAGMRENKFMKDERRRHNREMAEGMQTTEAASRRRIELENVRYETASSKDLVDALNSSLFETDPEGKRVERDLGGDELVDAMHLVAEIDARRQLSNRMRIDLITFSDKTTVEQERFELYKSVSEAKTILAKQFEAGDDTFKAETLGDSTFADALASLRYIEVSNLGIHIEQQDRAFDHLRRVEVAKAAAKGVLIGATIGLIAQEATSFLRADQTGLLEHALHHGGNSERAHQTLLLSIFGRHEVGHLSAHDALPGGKGEVQMPKGVSLTHDANGSFSLHDGGKEIAHGLKFNNGQMDPGTKAALTHAGYVIQSEHVQSGTEAVMRTPDQLIAHHSGDFKTVNRQLWYDNNTPQFDRNELGLGWAGTNGLDANGNYIYSVAHMTVGGSTHAGLSANAQQLVSEGRMKLLISASRETQNRALELPVRADGTVLIAKDSLAGRAFFQNSGCHAVFTGKFAEVAQTTSSSNGVDNFRILATEVGPGQPRFVDLNPKDLFITRIQLPPTIDVPPIIPIFGREALGEAEAPEDQNAKTIEIPAVKIEETQPEKEAPEKPLSLFELKERARVAVGELKNSSVITPAEREVIAANIGRITQNMQRREVTQSDLASLSAMFINLNQKAPEQMPGNLLPHYVQSLLAVDNQLARQKEVGWEIGESARTVYPAAKPFETGEADERPRPPSLTLFELKERARQAVGEMKNKGGITPAEREVIASNLGRITQRMNRRNVTQSDLYSLFSIFTKLHQTEPDLVPRDDLESINASILAADGKLGSQKDEGWEIGESAPTVHPSPKPFEVTAKPVSPSVDTDAPPKTPGYLSRENFLNRAEERGRIPVDVDASPEAAPPTDVDATPASPEEEPEVKTGPAIWRNNDADLPVEVEGFAGTRDGRAYVNVLGSATALPLDEIVYPEG